MEGNGEDKGDISVTKGGLPIAENVKTGDPSVPGDVQNNPPKVGRITLEIFKSEHGTDVRLLELQIPMNDVIIRGVFDKGKEIALMSLANMMMKEAQLKPKIINPMKSGLMSKLGAKIIGGR